MLKAVIDSIEHWKRLIARARAICISTSTLNSMINRHILAENTLLGESCFGDDCPLCKEFPELCYSGKKYLLGYGIRKEECPLKSIGEQCRLDESAWSKTTASLDLATFVERAENLMLPALYKALEFAKGKK